MTSKEILENFCNEVVYHYLTIPSVQSQIDAAGIDFKFLYMQGILAAEVVVAYQKKRKSQSHELAVSELQREIGYIEAALDSGPLSYIPLETDLIREKYRELYASFEMDELSKKVQLATTSEEKKRIIETMQSKSLGGVESTTLSDVAVAFLPELFEKAKEGESIKVIHGFEGLSHMIGGFNGKRLGILQAATGYGKTVISLNFGLSAALSMGVGYVNMEMSFEDMLRRVAVIMLGIRYDQFHRGEFQLDDAISKILTIGDKFSLTSGRALSVSAIAAWARLQKQQLNIELLIIDYDQKLELVGKDKDEWRQMQAALLELEELAKELDIYILVLAQVNRQNQISSSFRATFGAHTVLHFMDDETHGPIVKAVKNRHGKRDQALCVDYDEARSKITEKNIIDIKHDDKPKLAFTRKPTTDTRLAYADN